MHHYTTPNYTRTMTRKHTTDSQREENKILFSLVPFFWQSRAFFFTRVVNSKKRNSSSSRMRNMCSLIWNHVFWLFLVVLNIWDDRGFTRFKRWIGRRGSLRRCEHRTSSSRFSRLLVVVYICSSLHDDLLFASTLTFRFFFLLFYEAFVLMV